MMTLYEEVKQTVSESYCHSASHQSETFGGLSPCFAAAAMEQPETLLVLNAYHMLQELCDSRDSYDNGDYEDAYHCMPTAFHRLLGELRHDPWLAPNGVWYQQVFHGLDGHTYTLVAVTTRELLNEAHRIAVGHVLAVVYWLHCADVALPPVCNGPSKSV